jgi:glycosyltransferase involved in cell wall biosynthesis
VKLSVYSAYGPHGASTRVRVHDWLAHLGVEADVHSYIGTPSVGLGAVIRHPSRVMCAELSLRRAARHGSDRLMLSRSATPFSRGAVEERLLRGASWGVYDFDDALWADARGGIHRFFAKPAAWERSVRAADQVIAGNEYLADAAAALNPNVLVIPSCVEPASYRRKSDYTVSSKPTVVWLGSPSTEKYLQAISQPLLKAHELRRVRVVVISGGNQSLGALDRIVERVQWSLPTAQRLLADADIGIMPLPDDDYSRGKCAYKLLEYGAAGLPVVASPVGANTQVVEAMGGRLAADEKQWVESIVDVLDAAVAERARMGAAAHTAVVTRYSFGSWRDVFVRALGLEGFASRSCGESRNRCRNA